VLGGLNPENRVQMSTKKCLPIHFLSFGVKVSTKVGEIKLAVLVPHSHSSLREHPNFLQNFRPKNNTWKEKFWPIFSFKICNCILGLASRSVNYYVHFTTGTFQNLRQELKWVLWIRYLVPHEAPVVFSIQSYFGCTLIDLSTVQISLPCIYLSLCDHTNQIFCHLDYTSYIY
jgi:hypothetical protein